MGIRALWGQLATLDLRAFREILVPQELKDQRARKETQVTLVPSARLVILVLSATLVPKV